MDSAEAIPEPAPPHLLPALSSIANVRSLKTTYIFLPTTWCIKTEILPFAAGTADGGLNFTPQDLIFFWPAMAQ